MMTTTTPERSASATGQLSPIPMSRIVTVELRKMFDTRSGFWLLMSIGITSLLAIAAVIAFAPDEVQTFETYATAIGAPVSIILPLIATLAVTSEWSQRSGLTTFTLVPGRGRVIAAKALCTVLVGVAAMLVSLALGAAGNVVGTTISGATTTWDITVGGLFNTVLAGILNMTVGFTLGVLIRNSAGAIVAYFVYTFLLPGVFGALAAFQAWFRDLQPWVDLNFAVTRLYDEQMTAQMWAHLGVASAIWLLLPLTIGLLLLRQSEVK
jgi:ABC-2 type transport system permease protein